MGNVYNSHYPTTTEEAFMNRDMRASHILSCFAIAFVCAFIIASVPACGGSGGSSGGGGGAASSGNVAEAVEGASFTAPSSVVTPDTSAVSGTAIDTSNASMGYICAAGSSASRLKFQVTKGGETYNYDLPNNGTPAVFPVNMGSGSYTLRIMQNTEGSNYVELDATNADIMLADEFSPFLISNIFCSYNGSSSCVSKARELTSSASNMGEAVKAICTWVAENVSYDTAKAEQLSNGSGYVPNPDDTLSSKTGICFDYASLSAAMLRSVGIPTKIITGYVGQDNVYHAWIMVYIDGKWQSAAFSVDRNTWSRCDVTFASTGSTKYTGDASAYTDKYTY